MPYNYVTSSQIERTNELIISNNNLLSDLNNTINFGFYLVAFVIVLAILYKFVNHVLGVRNG